MVKAYLEKKVKLDEFITHDMTLDEVNDSIELMKHGKWYVYTFSSINDLLASHSYEKLRSVRFVFAPQYPDSPESFSTMTPLYVCYFQ